MRTVYSGLVDEKYIGQTVTLYGCGLTVAVTTAA